MATIYAIYFFFRGWGYSNKQNKNIIREVLNLLVDRADIFKC